MIPVSTMIRLNLEFRRPSDWNILYNVGRITIPAIICDISRIKSMALRILKRYLESTYAAGTEISVVRTVAQHA